MNAVVNHILSPRRTMWQFVNRYQLDQSSYDLVCATIQEGKILQRKWEWIAFLNATCRVRPRNVLEIGTYKGGTLQSMASILPADTRFISLDLPGGDFGGGYSAAEQHAFYAFLRQKQSLKCFRMDSQEANSVRAIEETPKADQLDVLFIDGDHSAKGVAADFVNFGRLVRPAGVQDDLHPVSNWMSADEEPVRNAD